MIQSLAVKYRKLVACILFLVFYTGTIVPVYAFSKRTGEVPSVPVYFPELSMKPLPFKKNFSSERVEKNESERIVAESNAADKSNKSFIDGPTQPEMSRFKPAGANDLVNLFTGDFSYNIPLLDVGGYPVNIFYDGGILPEQDASWVGLGWNINPGTVSRNMRGVPDDFDGTEKLITTQMMKPNITWGGRLGADFELTGLKKATKGNITGSLGGSLGVSLNNYLGPSLELGIKGGISFKVASLASTEKKSDSSISSLKIGVGVNANLSSRGGLTISPNVSMSASKYITDAKSISGSLGLSTSYNSRYGIKSLQINDQVSFNRQMTQYTVTVFDDNNYAITSKGYSSSRTASILSSSISFSKPSYTPSLRMPVTNEAYSGHFQLGGGIGGVYVSGEIEVYKQTSSIEPADRVQTKPMIGYLYYQKANTNRDAVVDFTRFNDKEVSDKTPVISVPQYSYDVFSISGEGTGGSIRLYRSDYGAVRDNYTKSQDKSLSIGADIGIPGHFGANFNAIKTPSTIGAWEKDNKLKGALNFKEANGNAENVYFRNPGETSVLNIDQYNKIGGTDLVRYKLGGSKMNPSIEPVLERFAPDGKKLTDLNMISTAAPAARNKRTQVVTYLTAEEATEIGLDLFIKNYNSGAPLTLQNTLAYSTINRVSEYRKPNHISQITVTEADSRRYIYGLPVYNQVQKDYTFTIQSPGSPDEEIGIIDPTDATTASSWLDKKSKKDGYLQVNETPAYAHSFLLTGLLSPDYVDVTGDGITEDDLGTAVKFNYSRMQLEWGAWEDHRWKTPLSNVLYLAQLNLGKRTDLKDDKGMISYGERESWYLHSIESKTMIALFTLEDRKDGNGASGVMEGRLTYDNSIRRLSKIDLYSKADLKKNGLTGAKPIKTVHFEYSYTLCPNTPDNGGVPEVVNGNDVNANKGKLTLEKIYFTYNGKNRVSKSQYKFAYASAQGNPGYNYNTSDRWGNYKPASNNPAGLRNADYPYSYQPANSTEKQTIDHYAGAWSLKKILLPSGGQIEVEYESDDYAYVQNRRAATMMSIAGFGKDENTFSNLLYSFSLSGYNENNYVLINVPEGCSNKQEVFLKYIQGQEQLAFKLAVQMPKGYEYINSYGVIEDYGAYGPASNKKIWVKLKLVDNLSPLSLTALEFLKEQLPGQAFAGYDVSEGTTMQQIGSMMEGMLMGVTNAFKDPIDAMRKENKAKYVDLARCFVRLNDPDGFKYGGGYRVKKVVLKDNWQAMTDQYTAQYGTEYEYTTSEIFNGQSRKISSGVASYEPSIGGDENPFQTMLQLSNKLPLGPTSYNAIEMPVLDAFFPAPLVGYSKVTVRSLKRGVIPQGYKSRSGIGIQVSEFYTAKDFPVYYTNTSIDPDSDKQEHKNSFGAFFWKWAFDSRALSQGFLVATNDMHGKLKSQSSYAENDSTTRISYTENFYRNTGLKGMNEKFDFIHASQRGEIIAGNMGIDIELMTDTREFSIKSSSLEIQGQLDWFPPFFWMPFIWPVKTQSENTYRAVTCTKVINYHSIVDSVLVIDKSSQLSTKNMVFDAETGDVIITRTNNEFDKPVYSINYPAYWAYSGMGPAYKNIDAVYSGVNFLDGRIVGGNVPSSIFESGDELYILDAGTTAGCDPIIASSENEKLVWALDLDKNISSLINLTPDYIFIDKAGKPYSRTGVKFRIVRSGKRNMLGALVAGAAQMGNPIATVFFDRMLSVNSGTKVINASALEFKEKWQTDNDVFKKMITVTSPGTCDVSEVEDCNGYLEKKINPYRKGLLGTFRGHRSMAFYGERVESDPLLETNLPVNGYLKDFDLYWHFHHGLPILIPNTSNTKWVCNNQSTRFSAKGLELENKNALDIYTSAQYGYLKTMPVAIANNSRSEEMMNESFEDYRYAETLNNANNNNCGTRHIDLNGITNSEIFNADSAGFNAHTGKQVLKVASNATASKILAVKQPAPEQYTLLYGQDATKQYIDPGGTNTKLSSAPASAPDYAPTFEVDNLGMSLDLGAHNVNGEVLGSIVHYYLLYKTVQYTQIVNAQNYSFNLITNQIDVALGYPPEYIFHRSYLTITIKKLNNDVVGGFTINSETSPQSFNVFLPCDTYIIECLCSADIARPYNGTDGFHSFRADFSYSSSTGTVSYRSLASQDVCQYTKPLPAKDSMMNPVFSIPENKKMLFSTWVREQCGNPQAGIPCTINSYTNNQVTLQFNAGGQAVVLKPSGPIIEGWQRYEGYFTAPPGATEMTINFVNNSSQPIYFDDIRIHPFNANMKTYVYDPVSLRLLSELDGNNYANFYEYDEEGTMIRSKVETKAGLKTIKESRSARQKNITELQ